MKHLARRGAKVYLAARSESKATGAIAGLQAEGLGPGHGEVVWLKLDLSDPRTAKAAAEEFLGREARLDVLGVFPRCILLLALITGYLIAAFWSWSVNNAAQ